MTQMKTHSGRLRQGRRPRYARLDSNRPALEGVHVPDEAEARPTSVKASPCWASKVGQSNPRLRVVPEERFDANLGLLYPLWRRPFVGYL